MKDVESIIQHVFIQILHENVDLSNVKGVQRGGRGQCPTLDL